MSGLFLKMMGTRSGATTIEYGLLCAFIALAVAAAATAYSGSLRDAYGDVGSSISAAQGEGL